jgi:glyoxylate reductase
MIFGVRIPPMTKPLVIVTRRLPETIELRMQQLFEVRVRESDAMMTPDEMKAAAAEADVLVPTVTDRVGADIIAAAGPRLKLIANFGNGVDNIDVAAASARGITVTNTPGVLTEDTADFTMALILAVTRRIVEGAGVVPDARWSGWSPNWMLGRRVSGKRLGILGMGRIGIALARRARAFGLQIHYHNRRPAPARIEKELEATYWESLDQMLARMDMLSVNCPHTPATFHLLSARRLRLMKPEAILVNTARGEIVDEEALIDLLEKGQLGGAGLDVFERAPDVSPRLIALARQGRATLLPHMASATLEGRIEMGEKVIINIKTFTDGHRPPDRVLPEQD